MEQSDQKRNAPAIKHSVSQGMQQALGYAGILEVPSAFSSNGDAFASHTVRLRNALCNC